MNITTRKKLLKAFTIIQIISLCLQIFSSVMLFVYVDLLEYIYNYLGMNFNKTMQIIRSITATILYITVFVLMTIYLTKKRKRYYYF